MITGHRDHPIRETDILVGLAAIGSKEKRRCGGALNAWDQHEEKV